MIRTGPLSYRPHNGKLYNPPIQTKTKKEKKKEKKRKKKKKEQQM